MNIRRTTAILSTLATLTASLFAQNIPGAPIARKDFWNDADFTQGFRDSYLPEPIQEPKIDEKEIELFRDLLELIKVNPAAAAQRLEGEIKPGSSPAMVFVLGSLYLQSGNIEKARDNYIKAIKAFPNYRKAHKNLGIIYHQSENFKNAIKHMTAAVELGERDAAMMGRLGHSFLMTNNPTAAESAYRQAIVFDSENKDWKMGLAQTLLDQQKASDVIAIMDPIIANDPDNKSLWLFQTNAYLQEDRLKEAAINLEVIKGLGKAERSNLELLGNIYMRLEMPGQALLAYEGILETDQDVSNVDSALKAANLLVQTRSWNEAQSLVDAIAAKYQGKLDNDNDLTVLNLQAKIAFAKGEDAKGASILEEIVEERDPNDGEALLELAKYYVSQEKFEEAIFKLEHAQKLKDYEFKALVQHGQLLTGQRKFTEAAEKLREALKVKDDSRIRSYLTRVERAALR